MTTTQGEEVKQSWRRRGWGVVGGKGEASKTKRKQNRIAHCCDTEQYNYDINNMY